MSIFPKRIHTFFKKNTPIQKTISSIGVVVVAAIIISGVTFSARAAQLNYAGASWVSMTPFIVNGYYPQQYCNNPFTGSVRYVPEQRTSMTVTKLTSFQDGITKDGGYKSTAYPYDIRCSNQGDESGYPIADTYSGRYGYDRWDYKPVTCPGGQVMTGIRNYQLPIQLDEEHVDAWCAPIEGASLGASRWVISGTNSRGYSTTLCNPGEVMTGVRMWGQAIYADDERIEPLCTQLIGGSVNPATAQWRQSPTAFARVYGYKETTCGGQAVMTGVRNYNSQIEVDDEHSDAYCMDLIQPTVRLFFSAI